MGAASGATEEGVAGVAVLTASVILALVASNLSDGGGGGGVVEEKMVVWV